MENYTKEQQESYTKLANEYIEKCGYTADELTIQKNSLYQGPQMSYEEFLIIMGVLLDRDWRALNNDSNDLYFNVLRIWYDAVYGGGEKHVLKWFGVISMKNAETARIQQEETEKLAKLQTLLAEDQNKLAQRQNFF